MKSINRNDDKMFEGYQKITYKCKCGHSVVIANKEGKVICNWCGNYVYADKKKEFKEKIKQMMKGGN